MKKQDTFKKFAHLQTEDTKNIKGGVRAAPGFQGGSGGSGFIDWGDIDVRNGFGFATVIVKSKLSTRHFG